LDEFVREETNNETKLPIDDKTAFENWLLLFIEKDPKGIDAYRTQKLGLVNVQNGEESSMKL